LRLIEKLKAIRAATASQGEPSPIHTRQRRKKVKGEDGEVKYKLEQTVGYLGVVMPVTPKEDTCLRVVKNWEARRNALV
ncbi:hypothetical protein AVEN_71349-2-1, partial [Araneus ventricosus]